MDWGLFLWVTCSTYVKHEQKYSRFLATEAVTLLKQKSVAQLMGAPLELIASDVLDHYRTYSLLERLLSQPTKLSEQPAFQLEPQSRSLLIEKWK